MPAIFVSTKQTSAVELERCLLEHCYKLHPSQKSIISFESVGAWREEVEFTRAFLCLRQNHSLANRT